jgi:transcriptional regulator with XRE-family HTH domain
MKAEALKRWRKRHGLSRQRLADELSTTVQSVWNWEEGKVRVPPWIELALAELERRLVPAPAG